MKLGGILRESKLKIISWGAIEIGVGILLYSWLTPLLPNVLPFLGLRHIASALISGAIVAFFSRNALSQPKLSFSWQDAECKRTILSKIMVLDCADGLTKKFSVTAHLEAESWLAARRFHKWVDSGVLIEFGLRSQEQLLLGLEDAVGAASAPAAGGAISNLVQMRLHAGGSGHGKTWTDISLTVAKEPPSGETVDYEVIMRLVGADGKRVRLLKPQGLPETIKLRGRK